MDPVVQYSEGKFKVHSWPLFRDTRLLGNDCHEGSGTVQTCSEVDCLSGALHDNYFILVLIADFILLVKLHRSDRELSAAGQNCHDFTDAARYHSAKEDAAPVITNKRKRVQPVVIRFYSPVLPVATWST